MKEVEAGRGESHSPPRRSKGSKDHGKNPYSDRGLEKFSALLADLDGKRKKIYSQKGAEDISLVHFVYSNANDCKPVVVVNKSKDNKKPGSDNNNVKDKHITHTAAVHRDDDSSDKHLIKSSSSSQSSDGNTKKKKMMMIVASEIWTSMMKVENWWRACYFLPLMVILILVFLAFFGRSFAILCTSIGWYLAPTINACNTANSNNHHPKKQKVKKDYVKRLSHEIKVDGGDGLSSPRTTVKTGSLNSMSPRQHGHKKSW